jgi:malate synthase
LLNPSNSAPRFDPKNDLPAGFLEFLSAAAPDLYSATARTARRRAEVLQVALDGNKPSHRFPSDTVRNGWKIALPAWCQDQRNQMTGPADDAELCVKMLNSGAPGVMLDLEDSCVNDGLITTPASPTFWPACAAN